MCASLNSSPGFQILPASLEAAILFLWRTKAKQIGNLAASLVNALSAPRPSPVFSIASVCWSRPGF